MEPVIALRSANRDKAALRGLKRPPEFGKKIAETKRVNLTKADFSPYIDGEGILDHLAMTEATGHCHFTLQTYSDPIVRRECIRLGLPAANKLGAQGRCMAAIAEALGGAVYREEWRSRRFMPTKKSFFRFGGYFPDYGLVVEFMGYQHYTYPNVYMKGTPEGRAVYDKQLRHGQMKKALIEAAPDLTYLAIREDDPYGDVKRLRKELKTLRVFAENAEILAAYNCALIEKRMPT